MIQIQGLSKEYGKKQKALDSITQDLDNGIISIIGKNGAGKTTLLRILSTQLKATSGDALIDGLSITGNIRQIRERIVSIPQEAAPIGILTAYEQVFMYLTGKGFSFHSARQESIRALKSVGLSDKMHVPTDELSGGMKRKMFVAMALGSNADTVFLDEPTTGLDPLSRMETWSAIKELTGNVVLTTHYMEEATELSEKIYMMDSGRFIGSGTADQLLYDLKDKVRVESLESMPGSYHVGNMYIKYVNRDDLSKYENVYYSLKKISIEDLFIIRGVDLES
ncbi:ABC transporter ATP-binding protein [Ferroplasma sp.]|uniref:ABC transporter ATP-binding protein n=1 Tax=Ferroplasma sp. TaxID=2591003 RepID=UPI002612D85C|nr:ABC transporter ATP-binding protein [Ferroplasma sp.]MCL4453028.1 ABC transporter ATP-binding protein [Candidatus Thermoplasmatota archaeon]